jgi:hypothetical protein
VEQIVLLLQRQVAEKQQVINVIQQLVRGNHRDFKLWLKKEKVLAYECAFRKFGILT